MTGSEPAPVWRVVLDANVLLQAPIRDTLLRLAENAIVIPFWSEEILAEVARNFAAVIGPVDAAARCARLLVALRRVFPGATMARYEHLLSALPIAPPGHPLAGRATSWPAR